MDSFEYQQALFAAYAVVNKIRSKWVAQHGFEIGQPVTIDVIKYRAWLKERYPQHDKLFSGLYDCDAVFLDEVTPDGKSAVVTGCGEGRAHVPIEMVTPVTEEAHEAETPRFRVFVKGAKSKELSPLPGEYTESRAREIVEQHIRKLGLRCLFRWEAYEYRCSDSESGVYGKIVPVEPRGIDNE